MTEAECKVKLVEAGVSEDAAEGMLDARWKLLGGDTIREALAANRDDQVAQALDAFLDGAYI